MGDILVGTAYWADKSLVDSRLFYPKDATTAEARLRHYATNFRLVEVDSSYYALPAPPVAELWAQRTPETFVFDIKAFPIFTQQWKHLWRCLVRDDDIHKHYCADPHAWKPCEYLVEHAVMLTNAAPEHANVVLCCAHYPQEGSCEDSSAMDVHDCAVWPCWLRNPIQGCSIREGFLHSEHGRLLGRPNAVFTSDTSRAGSERVLFHAGQSHAREEHERGWEPQGGKEPDAVIEDRRYPPAPAKGELESGP